MKEQLMEIKGVERTKTKQNIQDVVSELDK